MQKTLNYRALSLATALFLGSTISCDSPEEEARRLAYFEGKANEWLTRNQLKATLSCRSYSSLCDVVPTDPRAPFVLDCGGSHIRACTLYIHGL